MQARVLNILRENPYFSFEQLAQASGIEGLTATAIRKWRTNNTQGFKDAYTQILQETFAALEQPAIRTMSKLIDEGSFQASKYVLDNRGYAAAQKIDAKVDADVVIDVNVGE